MRSYTLYLKSGGDRMKKILLIITLIILIFPLVNWKVQAAEGTYASIFPDEELASAVAQEITGSSDITQTVTQAELDTVTKLSIKDRLDLSSIVGIQNLTKLVDLEIANANLTDISPISTLASLERLSMPDNKIIDLTPVKGLTKLSYINFNSNEIVDVSAIDSLSISVLNVYLNDNHIYNIGNVGEAGTYNAANQTITLPSVEVTNNQLSEENIIVVTNTWPPTTISNGGVYNKSTNMISWNDLSEKPANVSYTFSFVTMTNYSGVVTQPITYLEKPLLTADKEVSYPINISKTEEGFLNDVHAKTDSDATITSDYNDVVNLQVAGDYLVTLNAENTAGLKADPVQVTVHVTKQVQAPPIITADKKNLYESGAEISEAEFLKAIHAKTNDGSEVTSNFDTKVNLNKPGKYQVSLNAELETFDETSILTFNSPL